jgi:uncharacterized protein
MIRLKLEKIWWGILLFLLLLTACISSPQVTFYTLNSQMSGPPPPKRTLELTALTVGIGSVHIPEYLDRPQIVTFEGPHRLYLSEFHRWAGRLENDMIQVMVENLSQLLGTTRVASFPWSQSEAPQYRVDLIFNHFEGTLGKSFRLQGVWRLSGEGIKGGALERPFDQSIVIAGTDYEDLAAASSQGLWDLSQTISKAIYKNATTLGPAQK